MTELRGLTIFEWVSQIFQDISAAIFNRYAKLPEGICVLRGLKSQLITRGSHMAKAIYTSLNNLQVGEATNRGPMRPMRDPSGSCSEGSWPFQRNGSQSKVQ